MEKDCVSCGIVNCKNHGWSNHSCKQWTAGVENPLTVMKLLDVFQNIVANGYGDCIICVGNDVVSDDAISYDLLSKKVTIRGHLYNLDKYKKCAEFNQKVRKAWDEFLIDD